MTVLKSLANLNGLWFVFKLLIMHNESHENIIYIFRGGIILICYYKEHSTIFKSQDLILSISYYDGAL